MNEIQHIKQKAIKEHIPIIMDETLEVMKKYLEKNRPKRILEIGTAVGYSAICFAKFLVKEEGRTYRYNRKRKRKSRRSKSEYKEFRTGG